MLLSRERDQFICRADFSERHTPKKAGFLFDPSRKIFYTRSVQVAARLRTYADPVAKEELKRYLIEITPWAGGIRYPKNLKPYPFQLDAARFALSRNRSYLALDPGLGKTIIAALIMNADPEAFYVYICPPFLVRNAAEEIVKWSVSTPRYWMLPDSQLGKEANQRSVKRRADHFRRARKRVVLIVDEAHRYGNDRSGRSRYLFEGFARLVDDIHFLSGTPMRNRPLDLYPVLHHAAPETIDFMSKFQYGAKYCGGHRNQFGWDFKGATNVRALAKRVLGTFMLRVRDDVLGLDAVKEEILIVGENMSPALIALDREILKAHSPEDLMKHLAPNQHVATYRKELGKLTAKEALPHLRSLLDDTQEKLIIGAFHREVVAYLKTALKEYDPDVIDGSVASHRRLEIVKRWQALPPEKRRPLILQIDAGGVGFNLTSADHLVMVEFSWVHADNFQFYKRAHRIGRKGRVFVQYCVYKNSLGRKIIEACLRKKALADNLVNEEKMKNESNPTCRR